MSYCNAGIKPPSYYKCPVPSEEQQLAHKRDMMEREKWIKNVMRIQGLPLWQAENLWVRIQVENNNNSLYAK